MPAGNLSNWMNNYLMPVLNDCSAGEFRALVAELSNLIEGKWLFEVNRDAAIAWLL